MTDFLGLNDTLVLAVALAESVIILVGLAALWWFGTRDRWLGDYPAVVTGGGREVIKPLFSHETVVPEYDPPFVFDGGHVLRPAEMGVVMHERASTTDISATILDLAVRGHLGFEEGTGGDYDIVELDSDEHDELLPYERRLVAALFDDDTVKVATTDGKRSVRLRDLNGALWIEMATLKGAIYEDVVDVDRLFAVNPDLARNGMTSANAAALGLFSLLGLMAVGAHYHAGLLGVPLLLGSLGLFVIGMVEPRRTGLGREMLRRSKGFYLFLSTTDPIDVRFDDEKGLLDRYLPYAMVFGCARNWAARFKHLDHVERMPDWSHDTETPTALAAAGHAVASHFSRLSEDKGATPGTHLSAASSRKVQ